MKSVYVILIILTFLIFSTIFGETYALVVGAGHFDDKNIIPLPGAMKDAREFKITLINLSIVKPENLFYYENPTLSTFKKAIMNWAKMAKNENDILIFYYSGHGYSRNGKTYLIPSDAYSDILLETALNFTDFLAKVKPLMKTNKVLIILDSCYSGSLIKDRPVKFKTYDETSLKNSLEDIALILSSKGTEISQERRGGGGWFTYYLIEGLMGKANVNGDEYVTVKELYEYVSKNVEKVTNGLQHPVMYASDDMENIPISYDFSMLEMKALKELKDKEAPKDIVYITSKIVFQSPKKDKDMERKIRKYIHMFAIGKINYDMYIDLVRALEIPSEDREDLYTKASTIPHNTPIEQEKIPTVKKKRKFFTLGINIGTFLILPFADVYLRFGNVELGIGGTIFPIEDNFFIPLLKAGLSMDLKDISLKIGVYYGQYETSYYDYYYEYEYTETSPMFFVYTLFSFKSSHLFMGTSDLIIPTFVWNVEY